MSFRRSSSKPNLSREISKIRLTIKHDVAEIKSLINFVSRNDSDEEQIFFSKYENRGRI